MSKIKPIPHVFVFTPEEFSKMSKLLYKAEDKSRKLKEIIDEMSQLTVDSMHVSGYHLQ